VRFLTHRLLTRLGCPNPRQTVSASILIERSRCAPPQTMNMYNTFCMFNLFRTKCYPGCDLSLGNTLFSRFKKGGTTSLFATFLLSESGQGYPARVVTEYKPTGLDLLPNGRAPLHPNQAFSYGWSTAKNLDRSSNSSCFNG